MIDFVLSELESIVDQGIDKPPTSATNLTVWIGSRHTKEP